MGVSEQLGECVSECDVHTLVRGRRSVCIFFGHAATKLAFCA